MTEHPYSSKEFPEVPAGTVISNVSQESADFWAAQLSKQILEELETKDERQGS